MIKMGVVIPEGTGDFQRYVNETASALGVEPVFCFGHFKAVIPTVEAIFEKNPDIVGFIARSTTAQFLREKFDFPVVGIEADNFDFCNTIAQLKDKSGEFIVVQFHHSPKTYDVASIAQVCGISLRTVFLDPAQPEDVVEAVRSAGGERVVSSVAIVTEPCRKAGLDVIPIHFSKDVIETAMRQLMAIVEEKEKDRQRNVQLLYILNSLRNGVFAVDNHGHVVVANKTFCGILDVPEQSIVGEDIEELADTYAFIHELRQMDDEGVMEFQGVKYAIGHPDLRTSGEIHKIWSVRTFESYQERAAYFRKRMTETSYQARYHFSDIVSMSLVMSKVKTQARLYAKTDCNIMILGETGTGKEMMAQSIHNASAYCEGPFIAINCAALPEHLLESELFGYEEGAFTGAKKGGKAGLFELSNHGTLFLDEIGTMPIALQAKLLRCLQERKIRRVGGTRVIEVENRIISATNNSLIDDIKTGKFREDLYYRLDVLEVQIPPLRKRKGDLDHLVRMMFIKKNAHRDPQLVIDSGQLKVLETYNWPGNYRQLEAFVERLFALSTGRKVEDSDLRELMKRLPDDRYLMPEKEKPENAWEEGTYLVSGRLDEIEDQIICEAWNRTGGNIEQMIRNLGISRTTLWRRVKKLGLMA